LAECSKIDPDFLEIDPKNLTDFGVEMRYPGDFYEPSEKELKTHGEISNAVCKIV